MSDDKNKDAEFNLVGNTIKNRTTKEITETKNIIAILAWNECSRSSTTDCKG